MLAQSQVRLATMATILLSLAGAVLLGTALVALKSVLLWLAIAFLLAVILNPAVERLARRLPRGVAVGLVIVAALGLLGGFGLLVVPPFLEQMQAFASGAPALLERLEQTPLVDRLDRHLELTSSAERFLTTLPDKVAGPFLALVGNVFRLGYATVSVLFFTLFMLLSGPAMLRAGSLLLEPSLRARAERLARGIYESTTRYALGTTALALVAGVVATVTLAVAGVPYFLPLGAILLVLDVIPFVGAITGGILLTVVTGATVGWVEAAIVLAIFAVYQQLEGHLILPLVHRKTVRLSALTIAVALVVGVEIAGIVGVILAVPVAGAIRAVLGEIFTAREEASKPVPAPPGPVPPPTLTPDERPEGVQPH